ncbi:MAG: DNA polymerase IV [Chitinophagaceae bacterium]|jgi:DNA polymerase-4|nr:DNA polymerase IV [Chitinophagaceae bacterium]
MGKKQATYKAGYLPPQADNTGRTVAHLDLDSFFVSVEVLKNAALKGKPVIVGGQSDRGVVASCSYEARRYGVRSAMTMKLAKRLCPHAIVVSGDMDSYSYYSRMVTDVIAEKVPAYEKSSIDEFYIDMTGMDRFFGCEQYISELRQTIMAQCGLPISYGLSRNKLISKVATGEAKPCGTLTVPSGYERPFLHPLNIEKMPMVGEKTGALLRQMGVETIGTLSQIPMVYLQNLLGKNGIELWQRSQGLDDSPVMPYTEQKSMGTETTFENDTIDMQFLHRTLARMVEETSFELRQQNRLTGCVTVKLRYSDFNTVSKQMVIPYTSADHLLLPRVKDLFEKLYDKRLLVRLVGIRYSHLIPGNYQIHLWDDTENTINLYQAIDSIKNRFGADVLMRGAPAQKGATLDVRAALGKTP